MVKLARSDWGVGPRLQKERSRTAATLDRGTKMTIVAQSTPYSLSMGRLDGNKILVHRLGARGYLYTKPLISATSFVCSKDSECSPAMLRFVAPATKQVVIVIHQAKLLVARKASSIS